MGGFQSQVAGKFRQGYEAFSNKIQNGIIPRGEINIRVNIVLVKLERSNAQASLTLSDMFVIKHLSNIGNYSEDASKLLKGLSNTRPVTAGHENGINKVLGSTQIKINIIISEIRRLEQQR